MQLNYVLVVIFGMVGTYVLGSALEVLTWRGTAGWNEETRQRVMERVKRYEGFLRALDVLSFVLVFACVIRLAGMLSTVPVIYAPRGLVVAVSVMALERILRAWLTWHAFSTENEPKARTRALLAGIVGTVLLLALATWVGWWIFTKVSVGKKRPAGGATTVQTTTGSTGTEEDEPPPTPTSNWMTEAEALQYSGKDKAYLDRLTLHVRGMFAEPLRTTVDGRVVYRRDYLEQIKMGGFPSIEEMQRAQPSGDAPGPKPPKPLTESDLLKE